MKMSSLLSIAVISMSGVAFEASAVEPRVSDFRARSQAGYEQAPEKTDPQIDMEHPENIAPAAGGIQEPGMRDENAEPSPRQKLMEDKFYNMKR